MQAHVAEHEREEVVRVGIIGVPMHRLAQRLERGIVQPAVVEGLSVVEQGHRAVGVLFRRPPKPLLGDLDPSARLLGEPDLQQRGDVVRVPGQQGIELRDRLVDMPEGGVGAGQFPARLTVAGFPAKALPQFGDANVVVAARAVGDLEVALCHLHPGIELEGAGEFGDGLGDEALLVVEDTEIVVRPGVGRVDAAGK